MVLEKKKRTSRKKIKFWIGCHYPEAIMFASERIEATTIS